MRADEREAILVILDLLRRYLPALHAMTALAVRAKLPAMYVRVAIGAVGAYVLEFQVGVAFGAGHLLVHSPERVAGLIVIEFGIGADRLPARVSVAALARS